MFEADLMMAFGLGHVAINRREMSFGSFPANFTAVFVAGNVFIETCHV